VQHCDSTCFHCAQTFFLWLKSRMGMFDRVDNKGRPNTGTTFTQAAATSVRPDKE
jgi:hypothetical protein